MSPYFDDFESQLRAAARARVAARAGQAGGSDQPDASVARTPARPRRLQRLRSGLRHAPVLAAVAVTMVVAAGAIVLLGRGAPRPVGSGGVTTIPAESLAQLMARTPKAQLRSELAYLRLGQPIEACRQRGPRVPATVSGTPSAALLSILAVLKRPATPADRPGRSVIQGISGIYSGFVRQVQTTGGAAYYIVPVRGSGFARDRPSPRCLSQAAVALRREAPKIPLKLRAATLELGMALLAMEEQSARAQAVARDTVCLAYVARLSGGSTCGFSAAAIASGGATQYVQRTISGVVPDGVSSVTLRFPAGTGRGAVTVTADVAGNVFAADVPGVNLAPPPNATVIWRSPTGQALKTITEQHGRPAFCLANPGDCGSGSEGYSSGPSPSRAQGHKHVSPGKKRAPQKH